MEEALRKLRNHFEETVGITDEDWNRIVPCFSLKTFQKGEVLVTYDQPVLSDHWVVSGCFMAGYTDYNGKEHVLQFATENWWISDYNAFFNGGGAQITIDCLEGGSVLMISAAQRERLYLEVPVVERFFLKKITNGFVALQNRILSILSNNPKEQYEEFLRLYPEMSRRIPKKYIARYLGVSRETLSRIYV